MLDIIGNSSTVEPALIAVISAGALIASVSLLILCVCCKPKVAEHKAKVVKNVVAEEEIKANTLNNRKPKEKPRPRPSSMILDGRTLGIGRWDDLTEIAEHEDEFPVQYRQKKTKPARPPNPPDVILHPSLIYALREGKRGKRPVSVIETPSSPITPRSPPTSASFEDLIRQSQGQDEAPPQSAIDGNSETPLSAFPVYRNGPVTEKIKDGSIVYYRDRKDAMDKSGNQLEQRRESRARVKSSEAPPTQHLHEKLERRVTPSDPGDLKGLPHYDRRSGEWDNVPQPPAPGADSPPPIPLRRYLGEHDKETDSIVGVSQSDWSEEIPRLQNPAPGEKQIVVQNTQPEKIAQPLNTYQVNKTRSPELERRNLEPNYLPNYSNYHDRNWSPMNRPTPTTPGSDNVFTPTGSDNMAYIDERNPPAAAYSLRDYRNIPIHPDAQRYRPSNGDVRGRPMDNYDERQRQYLQQRQQKVNAVIQGNIPLANYDPNHVHLLPGVYLRPKPYYPNGGMPDRTKRFSDASDYSDMVYERQYYADRVSRDFNPYFHQNRWSMTQDPSSGDEILFRRRNSDFVRDDSYAPRVHQQRKLQYRRSLIEEEQYDSDIVRDFPKHRRTRRLSSGYQSQGSKLEDLLPENQHHIKHTRHSNTAPNLPIDHIEHYTNEFAPIPVRPRSSEGYYRQRIHDYHHQPPHSVTSNEQALSAYHHNLSPLTQEVPGQFTRPSGNARMGFSAPEGSLAHTNQQSERKTIPAFPTVVPPIPSEPLGPVNQILSPSQEVTSKKSNDFVENQTILIQSDGQNHIDKLTDEMSPLKTSDLRTVDETSVPSSAHPPLKKQLSNEYGSLIDVLYQYKQNVRSSRKKEKPLESPESRLRFEREKLKTKLKKELGPRHRQSDNLEMVIETLLYLCETGDANTVTKRRQRENNSKPKSRPNSAFVLYADDTYQHHCDGTKNRDIDSSDVTEKGQSTTATNQNVVKETTSPLPFQKRRRYHDYQEIEIPKTAPPIVRRTEFSFPSEEELNRILEQSDPTPPIPPPRRNRKTKKDNIAVSLPLSPASSNDNQQTNLSPPPISESGIEKEKKLGKNDTNDIDAYAKITRKHRRSSLPSMHLTESELKWYTEIGGANEGKINKHRSKFEKNGREAVESKFKSTRERRDSQRYVIPPKPKLVVHEKLLEIEMKSSDEDLNLDDIQVDEKTDAEDIIKEIERRMSERENLENTSESKQSQQSHSSHNIKRSVPSDSDMGTWSSVASSELLPTSPRKRLNRSEGKYPSNESTPFTSPIHMNDGFHTPPPDGERVQKVYSPPISRRNESLSPVRNVFHTPPTTPHTPHRPSPLISGSRSISATNVALMGRRSSSPTQQLTTNKAIAQFNPRKQPHSIKNSPLQHRMTPKPSSNPATPTYPPGTSLKRSSSKYAPKLPTTTFVKSKSEDSPSRWDERKRTSRRGEIISLPDDNEYSIPWDCQHRDVTKVAISPNRDIPSTRGHTSYRIPHYKSSPKLALSRSDNIGFFPITEDSLSNNGSDYDDYAFPVNSPVSSLIKQKKYSRSIENILKDYGTEL
ncbi:uncharacterized protein LOC120338412 isoform X1 [Styela clava]